MSQTPKTPLALTELAVERHFNRGPDGKIVNDATLRLAYDAMLQGRVLAEQAADSHAKILSDPSRTSAENLLRSRKATSTLCEAIARKLDSARGKLMADIEEATRGTWSPRSRDATIEAEVRSLLRAMPDDTKRAAAITAAIESGDDLTLAAVFGSAPAWVLGMTDQTREALRGAWRLAKYPDVFHREKRLRAALADIERAGKSTVSWAEKLYAESPIERYTRDAENAAKAALAAAEASSKQEEAA